MGKRETHGMSNTKLYDVWKNMKRRCYTKSNPTYNNYGGRGITICNEWKNSFIAFHHWATNNGYIETLTLDRTNNNGNYEPSNCRWITHAAQQFNTRTIKVNNTSGYRGIWFSHKDNAYVADIHVDGKKIHIKQCKEIKDAAIARNNYIDEHNLPHTKNTIGETT